MTKVANILATITIFGGLFINHFAGSPEVLEDKILVRFCPSTSNTIEKFGEKAYNESQEILNNKFCKRTYPINKKYFDQKKIEDNLPQMEEIPYRKSDNIYYHWLLLTPWLSGIAYTVLWASYKNAVDQKGERLEKFKVKIKKRNSTMRVQREMVDLEEDLTKDMWTEELQREYTGKKVKDGYINQADIIRDQTMREKQFEIASLKMDQEVEQIRAATQENVNKRIKLERVYSKKDEDIQDKKNDEKIRKDLIEALKNHEGGWLYTIITSIKPLIVIGEMGSGKSWFVSSIALCRKCILNADVEFIFDKHFGGANRKVWDLLEAKQTAKNKGELLGLIQKSLKHWDDRITIGKDNLTNPTQTIFDEFTNVRSLKLEDKEKTKELKDTAELWFGSYLTDPRKAWDYGCLITHKDTNGAYGEGTFDERESNTRLIRKYSDNDETPIPRTTIVRGLKDDAGTLLENVEKTTPDWFNPMLLYDWINEGKVPKELQD